ncbi:MAG: MarR family transcriptional regulator [Sedimentisphaerales bacterium]|nr:MarR family transcriptional regulator [Sedimentisphaerales bacterium]
MRSVVLGMSRCLFELILAIKRKCLCNEEQIEVDLGLSAAEFHGLMALDNGQGMLGGQFAERMGLSPSRGSRVLNKLVTDGLVQVESRATDRRSILVSLTPKGARMKDRITEQMRDCEQRICGRLDSTHVDRVKGVLEWLEAAL